MNRNISATHENHPRRSRRNVCSRLPSLVQPTGEGHCSQDNQAVGAVRVSRGHQSCHRGTARRIGLAPSTAPTLHHKRCPEYRQARRRQRCRRPRMSQRTGLGEGLQPCRQLGALLGELRSTRTSRQIHRTGFHSRLDGERHRFGGNMLIKV